LRGVGAVSSTDQNKHLLIQWSCLEDFIALECQVVQADNCETNPVDLKASMQMLGLGLAGSISVSILRLNLRTDFDTIEEIPTLVSGSTLVDLNILHGAKHNCSWKWRLSWNSSFVSYTILSVLLRFNIQQVTCSESKPEDVIFHDLFRLSKPEIAITFRIEYWALHAS